MSDILSTIARANQIAKDAVEAEIGNDITASQARYLLALASEEGVSQTILTQATSIDRSTLADVSRRLLKKGLIARKRTREDARTYAVTLTGAGYDKVREIKAARKRIDARIRSAVIGIDGLGIRQVEAAE